MWGAWLFIIGCGCVAAAVTYQQKKKNERAAEEKERDFSPPQQTVEGVRTEVRYRRTPYRPDIPDLTDEYEDASPELRAKVIGAGGAIIDFPGFEHPALVGRFLKDVTDKPTVFFSAEFKYESKNRNLMLWEIQPDPRYWADDEDFGWGKGSEMLLSAYVDDEGRFLSKFRIHRLERTVCFGSDIEDRAAAMWGGMLGLAVGDALGMPYETGSRGSFDIYADTKDELTGKYRMPAYRYGMPAYWYGDDMPAGAWTDDTAMTLAEMASVSNLNYIDPDDIMECFVAWNEKGRFTSTGTAIGQGKQTLKAFERFNGGVRAIDSGGKDERDNGDGSLMRMLPFVFCERLLEESEVTVAELSMMTHAHPISIKACEIYIDFARALIGSKDKKEAMKTIESRSAPYDRLSFIHKLKADDIRSTGYVVDALEASLWSFLTSDSYSDCVLKAIALGGDTDTIAAIAGSLAGLYYGEDDIPEEWKNALCNKDMIDRLTENFVENVIGL